MKLGTQTASLTNHIYSRGVIGQPEPEVGMGATILCWTDRHAATIIEVTSERGRVFLTVQEDKAVRTDKNGMSESQEYHYSRDLEARTYTFRKNVDGTWQRVQFNETTKRWSKRDGEGLRIGDGGDRLAGWRVAAHLHLAQEDGGQGVEVAELLHREDRGGLAVEE